ncbi:hypothetical protein D3C80_1346370 [compost metagenome]
MGQGGATSVQHGRQVHPLHPIPTFQRAFGRLPDEAADGVEQAVDTAEALGCSLHSGQGGVRIGQVDSAEAQPVVAVRALYGTEIDGGYGVAAHQGGVCNGPSEHARGAGDHCDSLAHRGLLFGQLLSFGRGHAGVKAAGGRSLRRGWSYPNAPRCG